MNYQELAARARASRDQAVKVSKNLRVEVADLHREDTLLMQVSEIFRRMVDTELTDSVNLTQQLLTEGLQQVFPDQMLSVRSAVDIQRGKVSVEFMVAHQHPDGTVTEGLADQAFGGAVTTVLSVLLRVILIARRQLRGILLMDETLPAVENRYLPNLVEFLKVLGDRMGVDMLVVTHNPQLVNQAPRAYRIKPTPAGAKLEVLHEDQG